MNQRKIQQAMKRMGVSQVDIPATEVIIKTEDGEIVISNPQVAKVNMMGQTTFQIAGDVTERGIETTPEISEDDIKTVMEQANVSEEAAKEALQEADGDLAEAILKLKEKEND